MTNSLVEIKWYHEWFKVTDTLHLTQQAVQMNGKERHSYIIKRKLTYHHAGTIYNRCILALSLQEYCYLILSYAIIKGQERDRKTGTKRDSNEIQKIKLFSLWLNSVLA